MGLLMRDGERSNPGFIGQDLEEIVIPAAGAGVTAYANDNLVQPVAQKFLPGVFAHPGVVGKLADAGTTYGSAMAVEYAGSFMSPRVGKLLGLGGKIVAGAKVLLAFVPNLYQFQAGLTIPRLGQLAGAPAAQTTTATMTTTTAPAALPPAQATVTTSTPTGPYTPVGL